MIKKIRNTTNLVTIVRKKFLNLFLIRSFVRVFPQKLQLMVWANLLIKIRIKKRF